jgi:outer membrane protein assembly factor BamB
MTAAQSDEPTRSKPLRIWPGVIAAVLLLVLRFGVPLVLPDAGLFSFLGALVCAFAIILWWVFFSRAAWSERLGAILLMAAALLGTSRIIDVSIRTGAMGMLFPILAIPVLSLALVAWAVASRRLSNRLRRASMIVTIVLACGAFALLRTAGISGSSGSDLAWRWTKTAEQRLLAGTGDEPRGLSAGAAEVKKGADWPGFRGAARDGVVHGVRIETDWSRSPPVQLWHRPIGPGWSSFAVRGDLFYTQEQRGEDEVVACYMLTTGAPIWRHRDAVRFWESNAGAGPRATPTLNNGRVYTFGGTGILNALDASTGAVVWSRDVASDTSTKIPMWGFASSPLVVDDNVIVAAIGTLVAYDVATGNRRWSGPKHGGSYSSPQRSTIDGVTQILQLSGAGITSVAPTNGTLLWEHGWEGFTIVQPSLIAGGDILISTSGGAGGLGMRRLTVKNGSGSWTVEERWTSRGLKPYFNDLVLHNGHAFGFDGSVLACIDLEDGTRKWKGGRYGNGQLILLAEQDVLLVLSEEGELALVGATPQEFRELARFPGIKGKTWNHPVLAGDVFLIRNAQEMAAYRLSLASR